MDYIWHCHWILCFSFKAWDIGCIREEMFLETGMNASQLQRFCLFVSLCPQSQILWLIYAFLNVCFRSLCFGRFCGILWRRDEWECFSLWGVLSSEVSILLPHKFPGGKGLFRRASLAPFLIYVIHHVVTSSPTPSWYWDTVANSGTTQSWTFHPLNCVINKAYFQNISIRYFTVVIN